jgi:hypothetical protein
VDVVLIRWCGALPPAESHARVQEIQIVVCEFVLHFQVRALTSFFLIR